MLPSSTISSRPFPHKRSTPAGRRSSRQQPEPRAEKVSQDDIEEMMEKTLRRLFGELAGKAAGEVATLVEAGATRGFETIGVPLDEHIAFVLGALRPHERVLGLGSA